MTHTNAWYMQVHSDAGDRVLVSDVTGHEEPTWVDVQEDESGRYFEHNGERYELFMD